MAIKRTDAEILECLCAMAGEQAGLDASGVKPESDFFSDLNFDSLDAVEYVMKIEEEFDVSIPDEQVEGVRTPRQAYEMLMPVLGAKGVARGGAE